MQPSFNLLTQPWIPCRDREGRAVTLGIRRALLQADELMEVRDTSPLGTAALVRLLLAVLHAALQGPATNDERATLWRARRWSPNQLDTYFIRWNDRFDLFHPRFPFYQAAGFSLDEPVTVARLAPQLASGNNTTLFDHTRDDRPPAISPEVAARWVVTHQAFALGGGRGPTSDHFGRHPNFCQSPAAAGANLYLWGETLFETLLLNLVPFAALHDAASPIRAAWGRPLWERDRFPPPATRTPEGYLDYLTWPNRCLRLRPEEVGREDASEASPVIRLVDVAQGSVLPKDAVAADPFLAFRMNKENRVPVRIVAGRSLWRDARDWLCAGGDPRPTTHDPRGGGERCRPLVVDAAVDLLRQLETEPSRMQAVIVGMHSDQAKVTLWRLEQWPVPTAVLTDPDLSLELNEALERGDRTAASLRAALRLMAARFLRPGGGDAEPQLVMQLMQSWGAEAVFGAGLEQPFRELLRALPEDREAAVRDWRGQVRLSMMTAFRHAEAHIGESGRALKSRVLGRAYLLRLAATQQRQEVASERT